jgi:protein TonB
VAQPAPAAAQPPQTYLSALYAHLEQYKRYPRPLQAARVQGTVLLRFTMNHEGRVSAHGIVRASGHAALDEEAESMIDRAQPLPKPPADMPDPIDMTIPIQFAVR